MGPVVANSGSGWTMYSVSIISLYLLQRHAPSVNIARPTSCRCRHDQQMNPWPSSSSVPMQSVATGGRNDTCSTTHAVHTNITCCSHKHANTTLQTLVSTHSFQSPVTVHQLKIYWYSLLTGCVQSSPLHIELGIVYITVGVHKWEFLISYTIFIAWSCLRWKYQTLVSFP